MSDNGSGARPARVNTVGSVGVVGLGVMGHAIATRLHQAARRPRRQRPTPRRRQRPRRTRVQPSTRPPPKPPRTATSWCCP